LSYVPKLVSERQSGPWHRCEESSFAMLTDKMTLGAQVVDARKLEAVIPGSADGTNVAENIAAIHKLYPSFPVDEIHIFDRADLIENLLLGGRGLTANIFYSRLPSHFTRWDPGFAKAQDTRHCIYYQIDGPNNTRIWTGRNKQVWKLDPLAPPGSPGEWMPISALYAALDGDRNVYAAEGSGVSGGTAIPVTEDPMIYVKGGAQTAMVSDGTGIRNQPGGAITPGRVVHPAKRCLILGYDKTGKFAEVDGNYAASAGSGSLVAAAWVSASALSDFQPVDFTPGVPEPASIIESVDVHTSDGATKHFGG
jgi:hypothetical protein